MMRMKLPTLQVSASLNMMEAPTGKSPQAGPSNTALANFNAGVTSAVEAEAAATTLRALAELVEKSFTGTILHPEAGDTP